MHCRNETVELFSNHVFWIGEVLKLVIAPSSTLLNLLLLYLLSHCRPLHINVRNLLVNLAACSMFNGFYLTAKSALALNALTTGRYCSLTSSHMPRLCSFQTGIFTATLFATVGTFVSIQIERLAAALSIATYEASSKASLSVLLLLLVWSVTIVCTSGVVATVQQNLHLPLCTELLNINQTTGAAMVSTVSCLQVLGLLLYIGTWLYHRQLSRRLSGSNESRRPALAYRLQLQKSLATVEMLLPSVILNAITWTAVNLFALISADGLNKRQPPDTISYVIASQYFFYLPILLQGFLHPLLFIWHLPPTTIRLGIGKYLLQSLMAGASDDGKRTTVKNLLIDRISDKELRTTVIPRRLEYYDLNILLNVDSEEVIKVEDFYDKMSIVSSIRQVTNAIDYKI